MEQEFEPKLVLKIRPATQKDAGALAARCFTKLPADKVAAAVEEDVARMAKGEVFRYVVAANDCAIANVCLERDAANPGIAVVRDLAVSDLFRGTEVAKRLMEHMDAVATASGIACLMIEVGANETRMIDRFKEWGFAERPIVILEKLIEVQQELLTGLDAGGDKNEE